MNLSEQGIKLIQHFESCKLNAYQDSKGIWTIGWGNTFYKDGRRVKKGDKITQDQADELFKDIVPKFEQMVQKKIKRPLLQNEFDALVSFCYNAGTSYKAGGTWVDYNLFNNVNKNIPGNDLKNYWQTLAIASGGKKLPGLIRRRKSESHLYLTGELNFFQ